MLFDHAKTCASFTICLKIKGLLLIFKDNIGNQAPWAMLKRITLISRLVMFLHPFSRGVGGKANVDASWVA